VCGPVADSSRKCPSRCVLALFRHQKFWEGLLDTALAFLAKGPRKAVPKRALFNNFDGGANVTIGGNALQFDVSGLVNTAVGVGASTNIVAGGANTYIGNGVVGAIDERYTVRIADNLPNGPGQSACYIGGIAGQAVDPSGAATVYIDNFGKLGVFLSSQRFKRNVEPMDKASEAILALKPVTFHYKSDTKNTPCFGLIAEEVKKISPGLVTRD
jgi:hypothetical protein